VLFPKLCGRGACISRPSRLSWAVCWESTWKRDRSINCSKPQIVCMPLMGRQTGSSEKGPAGEPPPRYGPKCEPCRIRPGGHGQFLTETPILSSTSHPPSRSCQNEKRLEEDLRLETIEAGDRLSVKGLPCEARRAK